MAFPLLSRNLVRAVKTQVGRRPAFSSAAASFSLSSTPTLKPAFTRSFSSRSTFSSNSSRASSSSSSSSSTSWSSALAVGSSVVALAAYLLSDDREKQTADCCGIVAFVGEEPAVGYLLEGLHILQNRGYDSAGVATINTTEKGESSIKITKMASRGSTSDSINILKAEAPPVHARDSVGIAHTRWATHGAKTDENAHPHSDTKNRIALVHNGTIENSHPLREELEGHGFHFKSQTDTEVIAQLLGFYLDSNPDIMSALEKTLGRLEGTWGLAILYNRMPGQIIAARNGSPLVVGIGKGRMFLASELSAFGRHTSQYISLNDGEVAVLKAGAHTLDMSRLAIAPHENIELSPAPFPHWTIKEIMEQPEAIARSLNYGARFDADGLVKLGGLESNADMLLKIKHLMIAACGTSLFAGSYGALLFKALRCFDTVQTIDASEVNGDSFPAADGGVLVLSQSGETKDTHRAIVQAADLLIPTLSVVNAVGSLIARTTGCGVYVNAGREHAVASTKAFTTQVTALSLIAGWYAQNRDTKGTHFQRRNELNQAIHRLPIYTGMTLRVREQCEKIAEQIKTQEHMFVLGKGYSEPIAREGALKIKEITYAHAEGYGGGALKHGPFALLVEGTPVILLIMDDQHAELMRIAAQEVKARGANVIIITDQRKLGDGVCKPENIITIPSNGPLTALLAVIPLQLLAYELALKRGIDPDKPRNLAKAVTVD